jgi:hypothetical protein
LVQPPAFLLSGEVAPTTKARVTNFEITRNLRQFILCGKFCCDVPASLFVRRHFKTRFTLEIIIGDELKDLVAQMERANWEKWEIESWILKVVTGSLNTTERPVTLRINAMQFKGRVMQRLPCSQGRILLHFSDFKGVSDINVSIVSTQREVIAKIVPLITTRGRHYTSQMCVCGHHCDRRGCGSAAEQGGSESVEKSDVDFFKRFRQSLSWPLQDS